MPRRSGHCSRSRLGSPCVTRVYGPVSKPSPVPSPRGLAHRPVANQGSPARARQPVEKTTPSTCRNNYAQCALGEASGLLQTEPNRTKLCKRRAGAATRSTPRRVGRCGSAGPISRPRRAALALRRCGLTWWGSAGDPGAEPKSHRDTCPRWFACSRGSSAKPGRPDRLKPREVTIIFDSNSKSAPV